MTYVTFDEEELDVGIQDTLNNLFLNPFPYPYSSFDNLIDNYAPLQAQPDVQQFLSQRVTADAVLQPLKAVLVDERTNEVIRDWLGNLAANYFQSEKNLVLQIVQQVTLQINNAVTI